MYIAEVAPPARRGGLGLMYQLAIVVGHIVAPAIGYLIIRLLPHSDGVAEIAWQQPWRWMFASETVCVLVVCGLRGLGCRAVRDGWLRKAATKRLSLC